MNIRHLFIILFLISINLNAETLLSYKLISPSSSVLEQIANRVEIVNRNGAEFEIYVTKENNSWLKKFTQEKKVAITLLSSDVNAELRSHEFVNGYKNYSDVVTLMNQWLSTYPDNFSKIEYGQTTGKKPLIAYLFKPTNTSDERSVKKVLITAATHGDELITVEVLLKQIEFILKNSSTNPRLISALKDKWIYFIPVVSPDSFDKRERYVDGRDPNRAYPWPLNDNARSRVNVIDSLMAFTDQQKFYATLDLHAYGQMVMYPWAYTTKPPQSNDVVLFDNIVQEMSRENNYTHGQISTTIYVAQGSSADYYYWKNRTLAIAVEIGREKIPRIEKLPVILKETDEMFYKFFEAQ